MGTKVKKNLAIRIITSPYRALCKAKDFYVRSITGCAYHSTYGRAAVIGNHLPRSYSASSYCSGDSAGDDLRELIRANSTARMGDLNRADLELFVKQYMIKQASSPAGRIVPRSASVGMGRIDEDAPISSFSDERDVNGVVIPRSKSHAGTGAGKMNRFS